MTSKRVLIVAPHFPPADTVDMHRVRMTVGHYRACGWEPVVLCARAEDTGRLLDSSLVETVPGDVRIVTVRAPQSTMSRALKINALGLRAGKAFERAGARLLSAEPFDLVFISTTSFPLMRLGAVWKARFGVPFVLDFQDPWATYPESGKAFFRRGLRHAAMRAVHRFLEARSVPASSGLMAVSQDYLDLLEKTYPAIGGHPVLVSPFGYSNADFQIAERVGKVAPALIAARRHAGPVCLFAGRVAPSMERTLAALFSVVANARASGRSALGDMRFVFIGTGYADGASERLASRLAQEAGIEDQVTESPDRISLLDAWKTTLASDVLLVMGSDDAGYAPSKLNALLSLPKPLICAGPQGGAVVRQTEGFETVLTVAAGAPLDVAALADRLQALLASEGDYTDRVVRTAPYEAKVCAARDCELFDRVLAAEAA